MSDKDQLKAIEKMNVLALLNYVMNNPEYLTHPNYAEFRKAIYNRWKDITL